MGTLVKASGTWVLQPVAREPRMDLDMQAGIYALELLVTQLISEHLRTVPDARGQTRWAREHLHAAAEALAVTCDTLDEEARLRVGIKSEVARILDEALMKAQATPLIPRSWEAGS